MVGKSIHTVVLDAGPIIRGEPSASSLLQQCENLTSTDAVISEIKDETARSRLQTTLLPFLTLMNPNPKSIKVITDFARKTGDLSVLSRTDIEILALTYELECKRNGGDWRLRSTPGQRRTNGPPPERSSDKTAAEVPEKDVENPEPVSHGEPEMGTSKQLEQHSTEFETTLDPITSYPAEENKDLAEQLGDTTISDPDQPPEYSDSEGWITPSNIKKHQEREAANETATTAPEPKVMQVATITTDFAMQNVLLQMNLNLLSPSLQRVRHIKSFVLRCHACFGVTKDMNKQFCPKCGQPTLTPVSCTTNQQTGEFKLHLKKNMQWNNRGNVYSIPKPVSGSASGRGKGGGKDGWGKELILAEDQKEYVRAVKEEKRVSSKDLMDEDYLPGILGGERGRPAGGRPMIGAGRNVNSRKR